MRIVIDGRMLSWTGIGRYTHALLEQLQELDQVNDYVVLMHAVDKPLWQPRQPNFTVVLVREPPYSVSSQMRLSQILHRLKPDLVHFPHFSVPLGYNGRYIVTLHDFTLLDYRNAHSQLLDQVKYQIKHTAVKAVIKHALTAAAHIITDSEFVAIDVAKRYPTTQNRVTAVHLAADPLLARPASLNRLKINPPFLLYAGNHYPYKNLGRLIEAMAQLDGKLADHSLVITGKRDYFRDQLERAARAAGAEDRVIFAGHVTDGELVSLYRNTALYCFPSLSEGFGLPGLEAMSQGAPVISSAETCLPEVYGDGAAYFRDVRDSAAMATDIKRLLGDEAELTRLKDAGPKRVAAFSWRQTAERTLAVYRSALTHIADQ